MKFSLVIPYHRDAAKLVPTLNRIRGEGDGRNITEVLLCHNGAAQSTDDRELVETLVFPGVRCLHTDAKGIGAGYRLGIENATGDYVVLSASDLPFGWTDVDSFHAAGDPDFAIGSKAHSLSKVGNISFKRRVASFCFLWLRRLLLGFKTPQDSQGSLIIKTTVARSLAARCQYNNYLFSLEIASLQLLQGGRVVELPIVLENNDGESSVSVLKDGWRMLVDLFALRSRLRRK